MVAKRKVRVICAWRMMYVKVLKDLLDREEKG